MKITDALAWLNANGAALLAVLMTAVVCWRKLPDATRAAIEQRWPRLVGGVRFVAALVPDLVNAWMAARVQIVAGVPKADAVRASQPPPPRSSAGFVDLLLVSRLVLGLLLVVTLAMMVAGCPVWVRDECPAPGAYACRGDQPAYCSPSARWTPIGDEPCGRQGNVCVVDDAGVALCVADASADGGAR